MEIPGLPSRESATEDLATLIEKEILSDEASKNGGSGSASTATCTTILRELRMAARAVKEKPFIQK